MALMGAMYSSSSALGMFGQSMGVIGNNLANTNTIGFKSSRTAFQDILAQSVGYTEAEGTNQVGNGANVAAITQIQKQGSFEQTALTTDLGIDGNGYFVVKDYSDTTEGTPFYTRAGDFKRDVEGRLVTNAGLVLQGVPFNEDGLALGSPDDIQLDGTLTSSVRPTNSARVTVNLDASADVPTAAYNPEDPNSYNFSTTVRVYDSLGGGHNIEVQFRKTADNLWSFYPVVNSDELDLTTGAVTNKVAGTDLTAVNDYNLDATLDHTLAKPAASTYTAGVLEFTQSGFLKYEGSTPTTFNWGNGAASQEILFDFGDASDAAGDSTNDFPQVDTDPTSATYLKYTAGSTVADTNSGTIGGTVQFASGFTTLGITQDGFPPGSLERVTVDRAGIVMGSFSNGQDKPLYQIVLANFVNESALDQVGSNLFTATYKSGQAVVGRPLSGKFGAILSNSLEQSNVDISEEVIRMISTQRAFQANSRIVSVVDGMLEEMVNLKR